MSAVRRVGRRWHLFEAVSARRSAAQGKWREGLYLGRSALLVYSERRCYLMPREAVLRAEGYSLKSGGAGVEMGRIVVTGPGGAPLEVPLLRSLVNPVEAWRRNGR